jgi:acetyltransferase-like isoleucine patch superfamily enzyme
LRISRRRTAWQHQPGLASVGRFSYGAPSVQRHEGETATVSIGSFVAIARDVVMIPAGNHRVDWVTTFPLRIMLGLEGAGVDGHPASRGDITVGNDVWIGYGATILSGVTIGDGAVVGARAVVARDVRPYAIVVGNPAREVRRRFDDATVERLLTLGWWDWPLEEIRRRVPLLCDQDVQRLLDECSPDPASSDDDRGHPVAGT